MNRDTGAPLPPSMGDDPDVRSMLAFQAGDDEAFRELVDRHSGALVNWFWYQTHDRDVAEDLTQEVWMKIHRSRDDYEPRARFATWLYRVARNHFIDRYRRRSRRPGEVSLDDDGGGDEASPGLSVRERVEGEAPDPTAGLEREDLVRDVAAAVSRLPESMREVFLLGEVQGLPYSEVAAILEIPVGTVKSRMFHAVRRLQQSLSRYE